MKSNIDQTRRELEQHPAIDTLQLDGDSEEAFFRALIEPEHLEDGFELPDEFEEYIENQLESVRLVKNKWVGFAREVTLR